MKTITSAIILAGGAGRRIWPYSEVRNKCATPVANVPNIRRLTDILHSLGITRIVVVVGPWASSIRAALEGADAQIVYVEQPRDGGTAGAARVGIAAIEDDRFLIVYGDTVTTEQNLRILIQS